MRRAVARYGELSTDAEFDRLAADIWRHPKVLEWKLATPPPKRDGRVGDAAYRAALEAAFQAYAGERGKPRWGDKTPYYINCVDELKRVFPEARIVNLVRDGRDVCLSLLRVPFGPANVWAAAHQWSAAVAAGDAAQARYGDDVLTVAYERMVTDPEAEIGRICAFAGLTFDADMLAADPAATSRVAAGQEGWFEGLDAGINADSVDRWRTEMSRSDQALFVEHRRRCTAPARLPDARHRPAPAHTRRGPVCPQLDAQALALRTAAHRAGARP